MQKFITDERPIPCVQGSLGDTDFLDLPTCKWLMLITFELCLTGQKSSLKMLLDFDPVNLKLF